MRVRIADAERDWARQRNWRLCIDDLDAAYRLDPRGFDDADWALRAHAQDELAGAWTKPPMK